MDLMGRDNLEDMVLDGMIILYPPHPLPMYLSIHPLWIHLLSVHPLSTDPSTYVPTPPHAPTYLFIYLLIYARIRTSGKFFNWAIQMEWLHIIHWIWNQMWWKYGTHYTYEVLSATSSVVSITSMML